MYPLNHLILKVASFTYERNIIKRGLGGVTCAGTVLWEDVSSDSVDSMGHGFKFWVMFLYRIS